MAASASITQGPVPDHGAGQCRHPPPSSSGLSAGRSLAESCTRRLIWSATTRLARASRRVSYFVSAGAWPAPASPILQRHEIEFQKWAQRRVSCGVSCSFSSGEPNEMRHTRSRRPLTAGSCRLQSKSAPNDENKGFPPAESASRGPQMARRQLSAAPSSMRPVRCNSTMRPTVGQRILISSAIDRNPISSSSSTSE